VTFEEGLHQTVEWYLQNPEWIESVKTGAYREWIATHYGKGANA
jgi:dTDP-glucose 4,6-dehydratase